MNTTPAVSVVTATRNRTATLERALKSIAAQDFPDYEAIVVDDGSDPEVQLFYDALFPGLPNQFRRHRNRPPGSAGAGAGAGRNAGIRQARAEFVAFLDDDDCWTQTNHLSTAVAALRRTRGDFYFANLESVRGQTVVIRDSFPDAPRLTAGRRVSDQPPVHEVSRSDFAGVMQRHFAHPNVWVVRRELLVALGGFWEQIRYAEDWELMVRIADRATTILYRPDVVSAYSLPEGNSISLAYSRAENDVMQIACAIHARLRCQDKRSRKCARAREAWRGTTAGSAANKSRRGERRPRSPSRGKGSVCSRPWAPSPTWRSVCGAGFNASPRTASERTA